MSGADEDDQLTAPGGSAERDFYGAGRDINFNSFNQPAPDKPGKRARGMLSPPYGDLPKVLRGQDELIADLERLLNQPDDRAHVLTGLGGTGKSAVALHLASLARKQDRPVWWVEAATISDSMLRLARALGADPGMLADARMGAEDPSDLLWDVLEEQDGWLVVINNADSPGVLAVDDHLVRQGNGWIRGSRSGLLLVTTRDRDPSRWGNRVEFHQVNYLTEEPGAQILCDLAPQAGTNAQAAALSVRLGNLPLALHQAGSYIARSLDPALGTFSGYRQALETRFPELMKPVNGVDDREIVTSTWELSLDQLAAAGFQGARPLLEVLSWFADGSPIPTSQLSLATLCEGCCPEGMDELRKCVTELWMVGLLDIRPAHTGSWQAHDWVIHPLVAETTRLRLRGQPSLEESITTAFNLLLATIASLDPADPAHGPIWQAWLPHATSLMSSTKFCLTDGQLAELNIILQKIEQASESSAASTGSTETPTRSPGRH